MPSYLNNQKPLGYAPKPYRSTPDKEFSPALLNIEFREDLIALRNEMLEALSETKQDKPITTPERQLIEELSWLKLRIRFLNLKFIGGTATEFDNSCYTAHLNALSRNLQTLGLLQKVPIGIKYHYVGKPKEPKQTKKQPLSVSDLLATKPKPEPEPIPDNKPTLTVSQLLYRRPALGAAPEVPPAPDPTPSPPSTQESRLERLKRLRQQWED